jgi:hypothetical protein
MPEMQHHIAWLSTICTALESEQQVSREELEEGRRLCQLVIEQNPLTEIGKTTLARIEELMGQPSSAEVAGEQSAEQVLEQRIHAFGDSFAEYGSTLLPLVEKLPAEKHGLKRALAYPFETFERNRTQNPLHNFEASKRLAAESHQSHQQMLLAMPDPNFFTIDTIKPEHPMFHRFVAGLAPLHRMMVLHPKMEAQNEIDKLVVLHECMHIPQLALRLRTAPQIYLDLYAGGGKYGNMPLVMNDDYQAYGLQIEAMNLRLDGKLAAEGGQGRQVPHQDLLRELGGRDDQWKQMEMLSRYAKEYFHGNCDAARNQYSPAYRQENILSAIQDGQEAYEIGTDQKLVRVYGV